METKANVVSENEIRVIEVENTPFNLVVKDGKVIITCTNVKACDKDFDNEEDARSYINEKPYELISSICYIVAKQTYIHEKINESHDNERNS